MKNKNQTKRVRVGIIGRQVLLLLIAGTSLSLTQSPRKRNWIAKSIPNELQKIKERELNRAIHKLYQSKLIDLKENEKGEVTLVLTENGKKRTLTYHIDKIKLKKPKRWDGYWRLVAFDIPENFKQARNVFTRKLKELGLFPLQKSVYVYPYDIRNELDFIIETFNLRPYIRLGLIKEIDNDLHLRKIFKLI